MKTQLRFLAIAILALPGCTSVRSSMLLRTDNNSFVGNSNGYAKCDGSTRPFKGVPITLEVPTHVDLTITETYYMFSSVGPEYDPTGKVVVNAAAVAASLQEVPVSCRRNLSVKSEIIKTKKVFTVDFKRPAAGVLGYDAKFANRYFTEIDNSVTDRTITDSADAIASVVPALAKLASAGQGVTPEFGAGLKDRIVKGERVVAYQRFDIDSPSFECDVEAFVAQHVNCSDCNGTCNGNGNLIGFADDTSVQANENGMVSALPADYLHE